MHVEARGDTQKNTGEQRNWFVRTADKLVLTAPNRKVWGKAGKETSIKAPTCEVANQLAAEVVTVFSCVGGQSC